MSDLISRQEAIDIVQGYAEQLQGYIGMPNDSEVYAYARGLLLSIDRNIKALPSAQPERDIPIKPNADIDNAWGIPHKRGVCPKCDYFLGNWSFFGDGKRITYCETCGQAIDWEGWENETD